MNKQQFLKLKYKILFLTFTVILIVASIRTYDDIKIHEKILNDKQIMLAKQIDFIFNDELQTVRNSLIYRGQNLLSNPTVIKALRSNDRETLYTISKNRFDTFTQTYPTFTTMHYHLPDFRSFLRVHNKEKYGDSLKTVRPMIHYSINNKTATSGFEHGEYDNGSLTFRVVLPIFDKNDFLGVLELGLDFSYINDKIKKYLESMYQTKFYLFSLIDPDSINFSKDHYYKNHFKGFIHKNHNPALEQLLDYLENTEDQYHFHYQDSVYFAKWDTTFLYSFQGEKMGALFYIFDVTKDDEIYTNSVFSSIVKPLFVLILMIIFINWIFNHFFEKLSSMALKTQKILDSQNGLIILTDGKQMIECNQSLLDFFGFESFESFASQYSCICDRFIKSDGYLEKQIGDIRWADYIKQNKDRIHKVKMANKDGQEHIFTIQSNEFKDSDNLHLENEVMTFLDITELEQLNHQLIQQQKQASLGEMIGNIAHQWRQPLSAILSTVSSIQLQKQMGIMDDSELDKSLSMVANKAQYLSNTINDFRDFIKGDKEEILFNFCEVLEQSLSIVGPALRGNYIKVMQTHCEDIQIKSHKNELMQVIINILNNAKDVLINLAEDDRFIFIDIKTTQTTLKFTIKDTAGGIPPDILPKIFEPYFTTKHQSQGTGLGLYMSHQMIVDSMKGTLVATNETFDYEYKKYTGAVFTIEIPLNI